MTDADVSQILAAAASAAVLFIGRSLNSCRSAYSKVTEERIDKCGISSPLKDKMTAIAGDRLTWISCF